MSALIAGAAFLAGVYFSIRAVAALYRVLDLWYTIPTAWPEVARGVLGWVGGAALALVLLPGRLSAAFGGGLVAYLAFYVVLALLLSRVVIPRLGVPSAAGGRG